MLQNTYEQGALDALKYFGLEKTAGGMMSLALNKGRSFLQGQASSLGQLGQGLRGMLAPSANPGQLASLAGARTTARGLGAPMQAATQAAGRTQAWQGLKGLAPSIGLAGAGYLASRGGDEPQQQPQRY